ncbi:aspartate aminotransferase family protein [Arenibaculum pallidiluteum]|uniref:aspartate aminotransferase family protein n=1 Tax=Arenibaculum pallidiluteum TaxID=2812559 RepID=UPI001A9647B6|nr:aspartate aminotransferase family protein [Arenibaculum pallidiluteum]
MHGTTLGERDKAHSFHPFTNLETHGRVGPLVIVEGRGVRVRDDQGRWYIEGMAGLWCTALGWGEERLVDAATDQMRRLAFYHGFNGRAHDRSIELAERLAALAPDPLARVFLAGSGSEANDTAVKLVWYYNNARGRPAKKKIIARSKGYHGVTVAAASLTGLPHLHEAFDLPLPGILHADCPHYWRFGRPGESEEDFATRLAEQLDALIRAEGPETVAAFIAEPVMGAGGVIVPPRTYFEKVQAVLRRHDVLMIADEVITGFGRTGSLFGSETYGIRPDIMTVAKALSSAYVPIAAVLVSEPVYETVAAQSGRVGTFGHGYTYSGHPVAAAVALETLAIIEERDVVGHVRRVGPRLQEGLRRLEGHPLVGDIRGVGLIAGVELVRDKATRTSFEPAQAVGPKLVSFAQARGAILRAMGDSIGFSPPLVISEAEIDELVGIFAAALDDTLAWTRECGIAPNGG